MATILIVDDRPTNREFLVTLLGYGGHRLLEAGDGAEGLALVRSERPDLAIADILMPTMDGYEFVRQLRAEPAVANTPVIFYTAHYHEPEARRLAAACGVTDILTKPCEPDVVLRTVEAALGHAPPPASAPDAEVFEREHIHLLTDKLSQKADELRRTNERLTALVELGLQLGSERDPGRLLQLFCDAARRIVGARYALVGVPNGIDPPYRHFVTSGMDVGTVARVGRPAALAGVLGSVVSAGRCFRVSNHGGLAAAGVPPTFPVASALLAAPIVSPARVHGWICLLDKIGADTFTDEDELFARMLAAQVGRIYENGSLYADVLRHASRLAEEVAERKRAEAEVRKSTELLRAVADGTTDAVFVKDRDGKYLLFNEAAAKFVGKPVAAVLGKDDTELFDPTGARIVMERDRNVIATGAVETEEETLTAAGVTRIYHATKGPYRDETGGIAGVIGISRDITERKRTEQRVAAQHAVVGILAEAADLQQAAVRILRAVCESLGWDTGDLWVVNPATNVLTCVEVWPTEGTTFAEFRDFSRRTTFAPAVGLPGRVWATKQPAWIADVAQEPNFPRAVPAARAGLHGGFGFPIQFGNEVLGVAEFFSRESRPPDDELLHTFDSVGSQIGQFIERKRTELALQSSKHRLQHVLASSPAVLYTLAVSSERILGISWISDNLLELLGYPPTDALDSNWWIGNIHPDDRDRVRSQTQTDLFARGYAAHEYRFRHKDGTFRWTRGEIRMTRNAAGEPVEAVGSWSDITEYRHLEDQFRQAQKMEAVGRLAGGVAHDFNNLLTVINGYGEMVLGALPASDPNRELVQEMVNAGERAAGLTRQLLAFSRKAIVEPKVLNLTTVVADVERMLRRIVGEDVQLTMRSDPDIGSVRVDPGQMEQVLLNLVVNARDAMPTGGRLTIEVRNTELDESYTRNRPDAQPGRYVVLTVTDTGCGMDAATSAKIFEPFFSTKGEHGTGLGLATVHGIVRQASGHVAVYSEIGQGTTFKVYLPRVERSASAPGSRPASSAMPKGAETIILVEDEESVRVLAKRILLGCGYTVLDARDGPEAVRLAQEHRGGIHLLLTDVVMPRMNGREVARLMLEQYPAMKVLYLSGYTDDAVVRHGILEAEVAFLQKPFTPASLTAKVRAVLDGL